MQNADQDNDSFQMSYGGKLLGLNAEHLCKKQITHKVVQVNASEVERKCSCWPTVFCYHEVQVEPKARKTSASQSNIAHAR